MPRAKKAAGTAADPRNGARLELPAVGGLKKFSLPRRDQGWLPETQKAWRGLWADPVHAVWTVADRPLLLRWAEHVDRAARALAQADAQPVVRGHAGQPVESPHYAIADKALRVAADVEKQLGVGALNRARLGLVIVEGRKTIDQVNAAYTTGAGTDRGPVDDPRRDDDPRTSASPPGGPAIRRRLIGHVIGETDEDRDDGDQAGDADDPRSDDPPIT